MAKNKLKRFADLEGMQRVYQPGTAYSDRDYHLKGKWGSEVFGNTRPIVLELGCGKGEYTVGLSRMFPNQNFIGIDRKGARIWRGAKTINEEQVMNAAFMRAQIQHLGSIFEPQEISSIWITFPDPQPQKTREKSRMTAPRFLDMYRKLLVPGGRVHLKTDSLPLHEYSVERANAAGATIHVSTSDLYATLDADPVLDIKTTYEKRFLAEGLKICYLSISWPAQ
ncbi:MAG: tRNA (guanosine(46)-N7)-methyltransferase TrmB [Bacteroidota bacterium]